MTAGSIPEITILCSSSSVAEHSIRNRKVGSSILPSSFPFAAVFLTVGTIIIHQHCTASYGTYSYGYSYVVLLAVLVPITAED